MKLLQYLLLKYRIQTASRYPAILAGLDITQDLQHAIAMVPCAFAVVPCAFAMVPCAFAVVHFAKVRHIFLIEAPLSRGKCFAPSRAQSKACLRDVVVRHLF